MSNIDDSANTNPASDTKMGYSTPLSGFKEVDYDEGGVIPVGSYMDGLPMEIRFAIVYSVCGILDRFPFLVQSVQKIFKKVSNFYDRNTEKFGSVSIESKLSHWELSYINPQ